jgi:Cu/Ag efflux protein CusF
MKRTAIALAGLALFGAYGSALFAQKAVTQGSVVEVTATIEAIDKAGRQVTLKGPEGNMTTVTAGPEVKRFDELKVGDKVTFRYYDSMVFQIRKPGQTAPPAPSGDATLVRSKGPKPGGTVSHQASATVKVKAIDAKVPSITVTTEDGNTLSFKVDDPKNLNGVAVGDTVEITYTVAVMISVK